MQFVQHNYGIVCSMESLIIQKDKIKKCLSDIVPNTLLNRNVIGVAGMLVAMWYEVECLDPVPGTTYVVGEEDVRLYITGDYGSDVVKFHSVVDFICHDAIHKGYTITQSRSENMYIGSSQPGEVHKIKIEGIETGFLIVQCRSCSTIEDVVTHFHMDISQFWYDIETGVIFMKPHIVNNLRMRTPQCKSFHFDWGVPTTLEGKVFLEALAMMEKYASSGFVNFSAYPQVTLGQKQEEEALALRQHVSSTNQVLHIPFDLRALRLSLQDPHMVGMRVACWAAIHIIEEVLFPLCLDNQTMGVIGEIPLFCHMIEQAEHISDEVSKVWIIKHMDVVVCSCFIGSRQRFRRFVMGTLIEALQRRGWGCTFQGFEIEQMIETDQDVYVGYVQVHGIPIKYRFLYCTWAETVPEAAQKSCFDILQVYYSFRDHCGVVSLQVMDQLQSGIINASPIYFQNSWPSDNDRKRVGRVMFLMRKYYQRGWRFSGFPALMKIEG